VTAEGRGVVSAILDRLAALGATPIEVDTDGVYFVPPAGHLEPDDEILLGRIAAALPAWVQLELDGRYAAMLSYKTKTYALLDERDRLVLKGSAFRSRGLEPFQRLIIEEVIALLLRDRRGDVKTVLDRWLADFAAHRVPLRLFARTETLQEPLESYQTKVRTGLRNPSACYELALAGGLPLIPGDQVAYYVAGRGAAVAVNEAAKLARAWDSTHPDENVEYYQAKVVEIGARFRPFTEVEGLRAYEEAEPGAAQLSLF
jgi:DNA polymerase elongation subunit (family B)